MTKEEIVHLGDLARIRLTDTEVTALQTEITDILGYVSAIDDVVAAGALEKVVGPVYNVFREDEVINEANAYTDVLLQAMPERSGDYLRVKKILKQDD